MVDFLTGMTVFGPILLVFAFAMIGLAGLAAKASEKMKP